MIHDEELDFGEDELVPQVQQAADVLLDHHPTTHSSSRASDGARGADRSANGSLNESGRNGGGSAAAGDQGVAGTSASKQLASTASETASAASTPPVSTSTTNKPHDETLDEKGNKLPEGWVSRVSKSTGRLYYRNTLLNTSEWDIPTRPAPASKGATPPPAAPAPQPAADELAPASSQVAPRPDLPAPVTREETQETRSAQQVEERKPRGHIHPDRLRLTSAEPVPAASPPTMPPTGPAADRNRAGAARYPPRRSSQSVNDPANAATTAAPPPTGPRATAPAGRQPLPPPVMPPTAPSRRRAKAAVTAANLVPVAPRGPRAAAAAAAPESPATPTPAAGTPTTEAPARTSSADDRWAAPKAAEPVAPNGPRFAVRGAAARGDKDLPPHLAHVPSGPRFAGSAPTPLVDDRWAKTSSSRNSRPASPPPRAEPSDPGRERQDSLGATSSTSGSGLPQAEKLEQQRLARLAVVGGAAVPSQPARHGRSPKRERVELALAPSANDRYAAPPIGPGRGKRAPPVAAKGANAMPVGGGGWGDRARLAKEKMEREAEEERKREAERKAKEEEEKKKSEERAKQRKEAERREREALRAEEDARREQERRAAAYGSRAVRRSRSPPPRHYASPPPQSRRPISPPLFDRRSLSPPPFGRRPRSPPPFDRRPLSPPPYARRGRSRSPPPPSRRPLSPPPFLRRGRSPTPPPYGRRPYGPPPHMRRPPSPGPPPIHYRPRSRSPSPPFPRGRRSPSPPMLRGGDRYDSSGARLRPRAFGPGVLDKSSSALRGKFRDPELQAVNDTPLIRTAGPPMPLDESPRGHRERPRRGGRGRGGGDVERERPHDEGWSNRPGHKSPPPAQDESKGGRDGEERRANGGPAPKADPPSNPPSLLSRLGSLPEKPSNKGGPAPLAKRLRDPDEVIKEDQEKRKRVAAE